jgi:hypothetical protein
MSADKYYLQAVYIEKELMRSRSYHIPHTPYTVRKYSDYATIIDSEKGTDVFNYIHTGELAKFLKNVVHKGVTQ